VVMERTAEPVSGALLELTCPGAAATRTVQAAWGKARSDAEGHFAFEHLLPATYQVTLTATGIEPRVESVDASEGSPPLEIVVRPTRDMTVCLADAPPCVLRGKVTGHDSGLGSR